MSFDFFANFIPIAIAVLVISSLALIAMTLLKTRPATLGYEKRGPVLSSAEQLLYQSLLQSISPQQSIFPKLRMADVLAVAETKSKGEWQVALNKISANHFDFALCDSSSFDVLAIIELDDGSLDTKTAQTRNSFVDQVCETADLPLIRIQASDSYNPSQLKKKLQKFTK